MKLLVNGKVKEIEWNEEYIVQGSVLHVLNEARKFLFDTSYPINSEKRRDMANRIDAVLTSTIIEDRADDSVRK